MIPIIRIIVIIGIDFVLTATIYSSQSRLTPQSPHWLLVSLISNPIQNSVQQTTSNAAKVIQPPVEIFSTLSGRRDDPQNGQAKPRSSLLSRRDERLESDRSESRRFSVANGDGSSLTTFEGLGGNGGGTTAGTLIIWPHRRHAR